MPPILRLPWFRFHPPRPPVSHFPPPPVSLSYIYSPIVCICICICICILHLINVNPSPTMAILKTLAVAGVLTATASAQLQVPMLNNVKELNIDVAPSPSLGSSGKPLVDSQSLQELINIDNLFKRSKDLYAVAELSMDEFNHPTRVIGSAGMCIYHWPFDDNTSLNMLTLTLLQATSGRLSTSTPILPRSATTTRSRTRHSPP